MRYDPKKIEAKWQKKWLAAKTYEPSFAPPSAGLRKGKLDLTHRRARGKNAARRHFYNLMMFPYPSAEGLHIGGMRTFTGVDIYGRLKRMQGHDVFEPIGLDAFGIHSENYALKTGRHPMKQAVILEKSFYRQLALMGNGFAWDERLETNDPEYYRWTQWIFVTMFKRGLAYRKKAEVNWCPSCKTVLADEQVVKKSKVKSQKSKSGDNAQNNVDQIEAIFMVCERCETEVIKKELEQWFFKITDYAERLLQNLEKIDWSPRVKIAQKNWIGKSEGALIKFKIPTSQYMVLRRPYIEVFTTRPDTLFGATYVVLGPEHPLLVGDMLPIENRAEVEKYVRMARAKNRDERMAEGKEKTGVELKGVKAINPANNEELPVWIADYVLGNVGTGAIMAVPAHDERDFEFAKRFNIPQRTTIVPKDLKCVVVRGCPSKQEDMADVPELSEKHWSSWVKEQLQKEESSVFIPLMPEPWRPDYVAWKKEFEKISVDEHTVVVGHSCGGAFLVRWLGETQREIRKLVLVAGAKIPADDANEFVRELYDFKIDARIRSNVREIVIMISDDDEERHKKSAKMYAEALHGKIIRFKGRGHFIFKQMGTDAFPELLEEVLKSNEAYTDGGTVINSGKFTGIDSEKAKWEITKFVGGKRTVQYRLRDWLISRQRYWGPPIPMIFCDACATQKKGERKEMPGWYAVPERDLPVKLPYVKNFRPTGTDHSPLASVAKFYKVRCPHCKSWARRETDVSDTFLDSAWYFLRYPSMRQKNSRLEIRNLKLEIPWNQEITRRWLPVASYIGGAEHSVLHLMYSRFLTMALHDAGLLDFDEPFPRFRAHGLITKDGAKMSKSRGNVVSPDEYVAGYGADAVRMYLAFMAPFEQDGDFRDTGIRGTTRFLERVWKFITVQHSVSHSDGSPELQKILHRTIKKVTEDIENLQYNTAISALMILLNEFEAAPRAARGDEMKTFLKLLAPFAPHITEELWQGLARTKKEKIFHSIHHEAWPHYDPQLIQENSFELVVQVNGKVRGRTILPVGTGEQESVAAARALALAAPYLTREPTKIIFVPNKLINFVIKEQ